MRIEKRNGFDEFKQQAEFFERSYDGGDAYREGRYLNRRDLESDDKYRRRLQQATYTNYCAPVIDTYNDYLMGSSISRDFGRLDNMDSFESWRKDMDGEGRDYHGFWTVVARIASIQGFCAVVVDKPAVQAETRAQELAMGARPYCAIYEGYDVVDWEFVREGWRKVLDKVVLAEESGEDDIEQYRIWYRDRWEVWQQPKTAGEAALIEEGPNALGVVPVVFIPNRDNGEDGITGVSDLKDLAEIARKIYNIDADIEEIRANTAFPFLELPERRDDEGNIVVIGPGNAITFDPENPQARAAYVEPNHASIKVMLEERQQAIEDFRWQSRLAFDVTGESRQVPSGYALEVLNEKLNSMLRAKAKMMQRAERRVLELFAMWEGVEFDGDIQYPRSFGLRDLNEDLDLSVKSRIVVPSKTYRKELAMKVARQMLGDDNDALGDIEKELEQNDQGLESTEGTFGQPAAGPGQGGS